MSNRSVTIFNKELTPLACADNNLVYGIHSEIHTNSELKAFIYKLLIQRYAVGVSNNNIYHLVGDVAIIVDTESTSADSLICSGNGMQWLYPKNKFRKSYPFILTASELSTSDYCELMSLAKYNITEKELKTLWKEVVDVVKAPIDYSSNKEYYTKMEKLVFKTRVITNERYNRRKEQNMKTTEEIVSNVHKTLNTLYDNVTRVNISGGVLFRVPASNFEIPESIPMSYPLKVEINFRDYYQINSVFVNLLNTDRLTFSPQCDKNMFNDKGYDNYSVSDYCAMISNFIVDISSSANNCINSTIKMLNTFPRSY